MSVQAPARKRHFGRVDDYPTVWTRKDGAVAYHCFNCGKELIRASHPLPPGRWIQAMCKWCGKERRFTADEQETSE